VEEVTMHIVPAPIPSKFFWAAERYIPPFENGDRMDQKTFHALYLQTPRGFHAELIEGVVHVPSPASARHARPQRMFCQWLGEYSDSTPGTDAFDNITSVMSESSEPQPDLSLIVLPEAGGQTRLTREEYLQGAPELAIEISNTTATVDLNAKMRDYERYGVQEYLVVIMREREVRWFVRRKDRFTPMKPDADGVLKSKLFPGLWLDTAGVFDRTARRLLATLRQGLASAEHAKFAAKLAKKLN
jgi:Uma2 family endonuclease